MPTTPTPFPPLSCRRRVFYGWFGRETSELATRTAVHVRMGVFLIPSPGKPMPPPPPAARPLAVFPIACALLIACVALTPVRLPAEPPAAEAKVVSYQDDIAPILARRCLSCHGPTKQESDLRLDVRAAMLRGGDFGEPSIVPGDSKSSFLVQVVSGENKDLAMPPKGPRLTPEEIARIRAWIDAGANMPAGEDEQHAQDHWSFQPLVRPVTPLLGDPWVVTPVDGFILERLRQEGLRPSPPADRVMLIRRLFLVMLGILPTPDEVGQFRDDADPRAYQRLVERVLASPRYGERWARHWLDVVRFGETHGFETNRERPNAWRYRDYVIDAFNADTSYDQFVKEQLAGDALDADVGTGFLVAGPYDLVKSQDINLTLAQRQDELADMINTTGTTFLGLTMGCARCHNHKFDPISQRDYYAMQAVFAGVLHGERALAPNADRREQLAATDLRIRDLRRRLARFVPPAGPGFMLIDDATTAGTDQRGLTSWRTPAGNGENPAGKERGHANDPGGVDHSPNLSGGKYTWWKNEPGTPVAAYRAQTRGRFRVWLSWGCGWETHTRDAHYVLDADGDLSTTADQQTLAIVDQQRFAGDQHPPLGKSLWSGFYNAGVYRFEADSVIALVSGKTGTAITADVVALETVVGDQPADTAPALPQLRPAVNARHNVEHIKPIEAKFVRFTIHATSGGEPCFDELQVWSGEVNVAAASEGALATTSGTLPGYPIHQLKHINDGQFGNSHSWISNQRGKGWLQIEFAQPATIDRIEWGRDREEKYRDRLAIDYTIEAAIAPNQWTEIASSADRLPAGQGDAAAITYRFDGVDAQVAAQGRAWLAELNRAEQRRSELALTPAIYAGTFQQPGPTHRLYRGEPLAKREEVVANAPEHFSQLGLDSKSPEQLRRARLADWVAAANNPLTARTIVNRLWHYQFGTGIVDTPNDLGVNGTRPTHPGLLDWLACEAIRGDWSLKHLHRLVVLSNTFRQSSHPRADGLAADGDSRLLWRFPPRRLEAEAIRDNILAVSGVLDLRMGGPGFSAFEVQLENVRHYFPKKSYGPADWRRMIYMTKVRQEQDSVFGVFDCPDASQAVPRRSRSTTPLQALNLFNSIFSLDQSTRLETRLRSDAPLGTESQVQRAFELTFSRPATADELAAAVTFVEEYGLVAFCRALLNANEFLFVP